jgi:hypothetical protein
MVDGRDDPHRGGIVPPCSFPAFFVATAATHRAYTMSLPGGRGKMIDSAWRRSSETAPILTVLLLLTSLEIIANLGYKSYVFLR